MVPTAAPGRLMRLSRGSNLMLVAVSLFAIMISSASASVGGVDNKNNLCFAASPLSAATMASGARMPLASATLRKPATGASLFHKQQRASIMAPFGLRMMADAAAPPATAGIFTSVNDGVKTAMKAKDSQRLAALRGIKAALQVATKEKNVDTLDDESCIPILRKLAKQRAESIEAFKDSRPEMAEGEKFELDIINEFLPALADEATTRKYEPRTHPPIAPTHFTRHALLTEFFQCQADSCTHAHHAHHAQRGKEMEREGERER
jgi:uncharacterized protein YqeY